MSGKIEEKPITPFIEGYKDLLPPQPRGLRSRIPKKSNLKMYKPRDYTFDGILATVREDLHKDTFICAMSGGKDSSVLVDMVDKKGMLDGILHLKTNIGIHQTTDWVKDYCMSRGYKLYIREPTPHKYIYVALCLELGFPSQNLHSMIMRLLKYKSMYRFITEPEFKGKNPIILTGIRKFESERRMGNYEEPINQDHKLWFAAPLFMWETEQVYRYFLDNGLKRSPVSEKMEYSGECNCGCFGAPDELDRIREIDPKLGEFIDWIADGIRRFGSDTAKQFDRWGKFDMPMSVAEQILTDFFGDNLQAQKEIEKLVCGVECGPSTLRGLKGE